MKNLANLTNAQRKDLSKSGRDRLSGQIARNRLERRYPGLTGVGSVSEPDRSAVDTTNAGTTGFRCYVEGNDQSGNSYGYADRARDLASKAQEIANKLKKTVRVARSSESRAVLVFKPQKS